MRCSTSTQPHDEATAARPPARTYHLVAEESHALRTAVHVARKVALPSRRVVIAPRHALPITHHPPQLTFTRSRFRMADVSSSSWLWTWRRAKICPWLLVAGFVCVDPHHTHEHADMCITHAGWPHGVGDAEQQQTHLPRLGTHGGLACEGVGVVGGKAALDLVHLIVSEVGARLQGGCKHHEVSQSHVSRPSRAKSRRLSHQARRDWLNSEVAINQQLLQ
jgi:hypothetical protein